LWKVKLCRDLRERGWLFVAGKKMHKKELEIGEGERRLGHQIIN
jgi:hypothetical protein